MNHDDTAKQVLLETLQRHVEAVLLSHVPEYAGLLAVLQEREPDAVVGIYTLLMEFGNDFLLPQLAQARRVSDPVRRAFLAVEELLNDEDAGIAEATYFGCVEPLGLLVRYVTPSDVTARLAREIQTTYPGWEST